MSNQFSESNGKVKDVRDQQGRVIYPASERSLCLVRNHRRSTTVNGVCLECAMSTKHTMGQGRRH